MSSASGVRFIWVPLGEMILSRFARMIILLRKNDNRLAPNDNLLRRMKGEFPQAEIFDFIIFRSIYL